MKRSDFEAKIEAALAQLAGDMLESPVTARHRGIDGPRYSKATATLGKVVDSLAARSTRPSLMTVPHPDLLPPCF